MTPEVVAVPFAPSGEWARWKTIYKLLTTKEIGAVLTYGELAEALDLDPESTRDRRTIQLAMRRAAQEFLEVDRRGLDNMTNVGYRVIEPAEHLGLARRHQRKATRSVARGSRFIERVDWDKIDNPEIRKALEYAGHALRRQAEMMRSLQIRQTGLEQALAETSVKVERSDEEVAELRDRMTRLEEKFGL